MTHQEILTKAIEKAIAGRWRKPKWAPNISPDNLAWDSLDGIPYWHAFVYSKDFAKALWGEDLMHGFKGNTLGQTVQYHEPAWQYHLQQMVIADNPIAYLGENI